IVDDWFRKDYAVRIDSACARTVNRPAGRRLTSHEALAHSAETPRELLELHLGVPAHRPRQARRHLTARPGHRRRPDAVVLAPESSGVSSVFPRLPVPL